MSPLSGAAAVNRRLTVLAAVTALSGAAVPGTLPALLTGAGLAAWLLAAAWQWAEISARPRLCSVHHLGLLLLVAGAVTLSPYVMFAAWILPVHAFALFGARGAFAWSVAGALLTTYAQAGTLLASLPLVVSLLTPLVVAGWRLGRESAALSAALAENTALQERLVGRARDAGVRDERTRMAREIHDTVAQDLSAALALLEAAIADGDRDSRLIRAGDLTRGALAEARRSVLALDPSPLAGAPLPQALGRLVAEWSDRTGVAGSFDSDPEPRPLAGPVAAAVYRVGQSALANVAEHARAGRVRVTLSYLDDEVVLDVRDDGVGFDGSEPPGDGRGFGLVAMRQRLGDLGGTLHVESARGEGTAVRAAVPA